MANTPVPSIDGLRLGAELRRLRELVGLTQQQAAAELGWSARTLIRRENGLEGFTAATVYALIGVYRVTDQADVARLLALAEESRRPSPYSKYRGVVQPPFLAFLALEGAARVIRQVHTVLLPGLLQTDDYTRGLQPIDDTPADHLAQQLELRRARQRQLEADPSPAYTVILDESVLHRQVGGPEVMAGQLRHLLRLIDEGKVDVRIIEYSAGAHPGLRESFAIFDLAPESTALVPTNTVVFVDHPVHSALVRDDDKRIAGYGATFDALTGIALTAERSTRRIADELARYPIS
ncbi:helix-turn-helix domain-containing protein [Actinokineospora globicatena]|uniref:helix-turn-helix domain-containing protein n=1 Tax=Actinokineospora globicatena TaxID=103729 RepID=UPI0020A3F842|nr:helix-turn-helix transcriptional regulator [Actinokineospora globicatena]MCP2304587.1 Helix-turn-helix domain-containing protein [Actinokineospora globicatena]GLW78043.1 transcriptional regulator [Actinokineospora globicatena]GLW85291.1 transcriptional regulator [Actinokineospora globicatena]